MSYSNAELFNIAESALVGVAEGADAEPVVGALTSIAASLLVIARADVLRPDP